MNESSRPRGGVALRSLSPPDPQFLRLRRHGDGLSHGCEDLLGAFEADHDHHSYNEGSPPVPPQVLNGGRVIQNVNNFSNARSCGAEYPGNPLGPHLMKSSFDRNPLVDGPGSQHFNPCPRLNNPQNMTLSKRHRLATYEPKFKYCAILDKLTHPSHNVNLERRFRGKDTDSSDVPRSRRPECSPRPHLHWALLKLTLFICLVILAFSAYSSFRLRLEAKHDTGLVLGPINPQNTSVTSTTSAFNNTGLAWEQVTIGFHGFYRVRDPPQYLRLGSRGMDGCRFVLAGFNLLLPYFIPAPASPGGYEYAGNKLIPSYPSFSNQQLHPRFELYSSQLVQPIQELSYKLIEHAPAPFKRPRYNPREEGVKGAVMNILQELERLQSAQPVNLDSNQNSSSFRLEKLKKPHESLTVMDELLNSALTTKVPKYPQLRSRCIKRKLTNQSAANFVRRRGRDNTVLEPIGTPIEITLTDWYQWLKYCVWCVSEFFVLYFLHALPGISATLLSPQANPTSCVIIDQHVEDMVAEFENSGAVTCSDLKRLIRELDVLSENQNAIWAKNPWKNICRLVGQHAPDVMPNNMDLGKAELVCSKAGEQPKPNIIPGFQKHSLERIEIHAREVENKWLGSAKVIQNKLGDVLPQAWKMIREGNGTVKMRLNCSAATRPSDPLSNLGSPGSFGQGAERFRDIHGSCGISGLDGFSGNQDWISGDTSWPAVDNVLGRMDKLVQDFWPLDAAGPPRSREIVRHLDVHWPRAISRLQKHLATDTLKGGKIKEDSRGSRKTKVLKPWEVGDRIGITKRNLPRGAGEVGWKPAIISTRKGRQYPGTPATTRHDIMGLLPQCRCLPTLHRPHCPKQTKIKSRLTLLSPNSRPLYPVPSIGLQSIQSRSGGVDWGPGGFGDPLNPSSVTGFEDFFGNLGSVSGDALWSGQGPGSELLQAFEPNDDWPGIPLDVSESPSGLPSFQTQYHSGGDSAVQQPVNAPPPPVPLHVGTQSQEYKAGWNAGFVAGCALTSRMLGGMPPGALRMHPDPTGLLQAQNLPSTHMVPHFPSHNAPPVQPTTNLENPAALLPQAPRDLVAETNDNQAQSPATPNPSQVISSNDVPNDSQNNAASTSQDTASGPSVHASTSSAPTSSDTTQAFRHGHDKKKHRCKDCDKTFHRKYQLDDHMHRHRGEPKAHSCDFPGCKKLFTNRANMRRHQKIHKPTAQEDDNST